MNTEFYNQEAPLALETAAKAHLAETARWGRFLAIVGFVMIALIVLAAALFMAMGSALTEAMAQSGGPAFSGQVFGVIYLILGGIYLYPTVQLFNFAKNTKAALQSNQSQLITESMGNLKSVFKFFGIITILVIALYAIMLVFVLAIGAGGLMGR